MNVAPETSPTPRARLAQLDVLRGVAIVLVFGRHAPIHPTEAGAMLPLAGVWARFGWTGVDLFFVLSGFLVGGLLFHEIRTHSRLDVRRFLVRRIFKVWPAYFVYLAFVFVSLIVFQQQAPLLAIHLLVPNLLHVQNYLGTPRLHTWSLAVEEHFYLALPCLLWLATTRKRKPERILPLVLTLAAGLALVCTVWRCLIAYRYPSSLTSGEDLLLPTHLRLDSLFTGVLIAYLYHFRPRVLEFLARRRWLLLVTGTMLVSPMMVLRVKTALVVPSVGLTLLYAGYGCILVALLYTPLAGPRVDWLSRCLASAPARALAWFGTYSYSIYLWHADASSILVGPWLRHGLFQQFSPEVRWLCAMVLYVMIGSAMGVVMGELVEKPALALRERLFPSRAAVLRRAGGHPQPVRPVGGVSSEGSAT